VNDSKKKYVLDWPIVPNTWLVKISTNLSKDEVLALEDAGFQLQQREALSLRRRLSTITTLPDPRSHFSMPVAARFFLKFLSNLVLSLNDRFNK
jgi:hypothetical protein